MLLPLLASAGSAWAGSAPVIDSLTASAPSVPPGGTLTLAVAAHDPDCTGGACTSGCGAYIRADLTAWAADAGLIVAANNGLSASPYSATADWLAPDVEGTYTIQVSLADSGTFLCGGRNTVAGQVSVLVTTSTNQPPVVEAVTASPAQLYPGQAASLKCLASDPESDPLSLTWSADTGTLTADGDRAVFIATRPGLARVTCTASDPSGASAEGTVRVSVSGAVAETRLQQGLVAPQRVALDGRGGVYVADPGSGAIVALNLAGGALVYTLPMPGVSSVAVDWDERLLVGDATGARVLARDGHEVLALDPGEPLGGVADVAVDRSRRRYAVLHPETALVVVYSEDGARIGAVGGSGDGPSEFRRPQGVAFTPQGDIVVADGGHALVKVLGLDGALHLSFGGSGSTPGTFVRLDDVDVDEDGVIYASDAFQSWVQSFDADGSLREVIGTWGEAVGRFRTPTGIAASSPARKLVVASLNTSSLEVFRSGGAGPPPRLPRPVLSAAALAFPPSPVGGASRAQSVMLANVGEAPLGLHRVTLNGEFQQTSDCGSFLDPGQTCRFRVSHIPETPGAAAGALVLHTSANPSVWRVALSAEAYQPALAVLDPRRVTFRPQRVGTLSEPSLLTVTNTGGRTLTLAGAHVSGAFALANGCRTLLSPGASCRLSVFFAPDAVGHLTGELTVDSDAANGAQVALLGGTGLPPALRAQPAVLDFGTRRVGATSPAATIVLTNQDGAPVVIEAVEVAGAAPFAVADDRCSGRSLASGQGCALQIVFAPEQPGEFTAGVRVTSNGGEVQEVTALAGRSGASAPDEPIFSDDFETGDLSKWTRVVAGETLLRLGADVAGARMDFEEASPEAPLGRVLRVSNARAVPVAVDGLVVESDSTGAFVVVADECSGRRLAPGSGCAVKLAFTPRGSSVETATLTLLTSTGRESLTLTGRGATEKAR